ncbi:glycosyltransferase, partial [Kaistella sp.]
MFDYYSSINRKNPIGAVEAYEKAFGKNHSSTLLVIKSSLSNEFPREKKQLLDRIGNNSSIILVEEVMERERLFGLMNCCDSFVSLHRSEGFGLTMAEAMYLGKPVIATGYSANTEFMNLNNSFLVKYNLIKTGNLYYFSTEDDIWADPDLSHAAEMMKYVLENPDHSKTIADQGQQYIKRNLAPKLIGKKIEKRLKFIHTELFPKMHAKTSSAEALLLLETKIQQQ